jgi:hypothetical protein
MFIAWTPKWIDPPPPGRAAGARGLGEARKELSPSAIMCAVDRYVKTSQLITSETKNTEVICVL